MAAKTAAPEATYDAFAQAGNKAVKEGIEKSMNAFGELNSFSKDNVEAMVESMTAAGKSMEQINTHVLAYTKRTIEDSVSAAKRMATVKSVQEVVEIQTDFARGSFEAYVGEVNKMSELVSAAVKDAVKPINARVTAAVEIMQAQR